MHLSFPFSCVTAGEEGESRRSLELPHFPTTPPSVWLNLFVRLITTRLLVFMGGH